MRRATVLAVGLVASFVPVGAANATIIQTGEQAVKIAPPPSVNFNQLQSDTQQFVFDEQQHVTLQASLPVDVTGPGLYDQESDLTPGTIPAGTTVSSQFVHCDNESQQVHQQIEGLVKTDTDILGLALLAPSLDASDAPLGNPTTDYPTGRSQRRLNLDGQNDFVIEQIDRRTVIVHCDVVSHVDQVRIITASTVNSTTTTQIHDAADNDVTGTPVPVGTVVHDTVTVTGASPAPTGTVTFSRYSNSSCSGTPDATETVSLAADGTASSSSFTPAAGGASYSATYNGDAVDNPSTGSCEPLTVTKLSSSTSTQVHNTAHQDITGTTQPAGTVVHDSATVSGSGPTPTGSVTFSRYTSGDCSGTAASTETVSLSGGSAESSTFTTVPGSLSYAVHFGGDGTYTASDGPCETLTVSKLNSSTATQILDYHNNDITGTAVAAGSSIRDKAIVTGSGPTPTGTVSFSRYTNGTCYGTPAATQSGVALSNGSAISSAFTTVQGSLSYMVHYSGDARYNASDGPCETLKVEKIGSCGKDDYWWHDFHNFGQWTDYHTTDSFEAVFGRDAFAGSPSLLTVLGYTGGGVPGLAREAVAALLNARNANIDYPLTSTQVIADFQQAYDSHNAYTIAQWICYLQQLNSHCGCH